MKTLGSAVLATIVAALVVASADQKNSAGVVVSLMDGSRIMGQTTLENVPVVGISVGHLTVPLHQLKSIKIGGDLQPATLTFTNGDRIQGAIELKTIPLQTSFGKISIRLSTIAQVEMIMIYPVGNLLVNGSFEEGPDIQAIRSRPLDAGSEELVGWKVIRGQIDYIDGWEGSDGKRCLDLNGSPGIGGIAQQFHTIHGWQYQVTFMMAGNPAIPRITTLRVAAAGQSEDFSFDTSGKNTTSNTGWVTNTWTFTAEGATTTLEIYSTDQQSDREGPALDSVSVILKDRQTGGDPLPIATSPRR